METQTEILPIKQGLVLDMLDQQHPALSANSDMPVIETKPDATPEKVAEAALEVEEPEAEQSEESATSATEEQPGADPEKKKPSRGVQKRLDELTKQREDAERRADAERAEKDRLLKLLEQSQSKPEPVVVQDEPVRPSRADFADDNAFMDAVSEYVDKKADFIATKRQAEAEKQKTETAIADGQRMVREAYQERVKKAQDQYADFKEVAESPDVIVSMPMVHAILRHEQGPALQYYLGKNPQEAERILKLDPPSQLVELGVIAATKLNDPVKEPLNPKPVSAAPRPLSQTKASESVAVKDPSTMTMDEYAKWRKSGGRH